MSPVFVNTVNADRAVMLESVRAALRFRRKNLDAPFFILAALCVVWGTWFLIPISSPSFSSRTRFSLIGCRC